MSSQVFPPKADPPLADITGVILTGGKSRRMGEDKAFLKMGGATIIERMVSTLKPLFKEVFIVTKDTKKFKGLGVRVVKDLIPLQNPLVGIYTALIVSKFSHCFVFACDMPFLNRELIKYMVKIHRGYDVVIPKDSSGIHPLHAIYSKRCLRIIRGHIADRDFKLAELFKLLKVRRIGQDTLLRLDSEGMALFNLNTKSDLLLAQNACQSGKMA